MSHSAGSIQPVTPNITIGPGSLRPPDDTNTWEENFLHTPAATGTKFLILHFIDANFSIGDRLEVDLGYDIDVFNSDSGLEFFTRPIKVIGDAPVSIKYITDGTRPGSESGSVVLSEYGRGEAVRSSGGASPSRANATNPDIFLLDPEYREPEYETRGLCTDIPNWEDVNCIPDSAMVLKNAANATCILVILHEGEVTTCTGTLIDSDMVLTAGHCFGSEDAIEARSGSACFDFQIECNRSTPDPYNPKFFKIKSIVRINTSLDYCILQLDSPITGIGVIPVPMSISLPSVGDLVFAVHHPNSAVKKISPPSSSTLSAVSSVDPITGELTFGNIDIAGGSSGSSLFDASGNLIGINNRSGECRNRGRGSFRIARDINSTPTLPFQRDVMVVFDRSGSMSSTGLSGSSKMEEAQAAAELFVALLREDVGDTIGMVSFSSDTSSPIDFGLVPVDNASKTNLNIRIGDLSSGGLTTLGGGVQAAQNELEMAGTDTNRNTILLLTDGLQNREPMIEAIESRLSNTDLCVIGFGQESSLNGALLSRIASAHGGLYTRAGNGLALKKFFVLCFGNIFESGTAFDPYFLLNKDSLEATPENVHVCGETSLTVVLGWDKAQNPLDLSLLSPSGNTIDHSSVGVEYKKGKTWSFLRFELPYEGDQDGIWKIHVERSSFVEFPPPQEDVNYFLEAIVKGGPKLEPVINRRRYYSGESYNPLVRIFNQNQTIPHHVEMKLHVEKPINGLGALLAKSGLSGPGMINGDPLNARQNSLIELEKRNNGESLINYQNDEFELFDDGDHEDGAFEPDGIYGNILSDLLVQEGTYTMHAKATIGDVCQGKREAIWNIVVAIGIDSGASEISTSLIETLADGRQKVKIVIFPKDKYGNLLGPGRLGDITITTPAGSEACSSIQDNGDGSYQLEVKWDDSISGAPGIIIAQPDRPPIVVNDDVFGAENNSSGINYKVWFWILLILLILLILVVIVF